ncbi:MAG TPA: hypothetical protein VH857_11280 [Actinomycetes bacterium]|nr:hypothetical protein [Actinomycetes bacterium]
MGVSLGAENPWERGLAGGVALGAGLCLGIALLAAVPANRLADSLVARHVIVAGPTVDEPHWMPSSFPDFGVTFSVPSWCASRAPAASSVAP